MQAENRHTNWPSMFRGGSNTRTEFHLRAISCLRRSPPSLAEEGPKEAWTRGTAPSASNQKVSQVPRACPSPRAPTSSRVGGGAHWLMGLLTLVCRAGLQPWCLACPSPSASCGPLIRLSLLASHTWSSSSLGSRALLCLGAGGVKASSQPHCQARESPEVLGALPCSSFYVDLLRFYGFLMSITSDIVLVT